MSLVLARALASNTAVARFNLASRDQGLWPVDAEPPFLCVIVESVVPGRPEVHYFEAPCLSPKTR